MQVVVGCYDGGVYFLDLGSGAVLWKFMTLGEVLSLFFCPVDDFFICLPLSLDDLVPAHP